MTQHKGIGGNSNAGHSGSSGVEIADLVNALNDLSLAATAKTDL